MAILPDVLETTALEQVASGFVFTEGPLWDPAGFFYFVDVRENGSCIATHLGDTPQRFARPKAATARPSTSKAA